MEGISVHDAWIAYVCINYLSLNTVKVGQSLLTPAQALEDAVWRCAHCGFVHSKEADIPFPNWDEEHKAADSKPAESFWRGFFRSVTEHPESYWK